MTFEYPENEDDAVGLNELVYIVHEPTEDSIKRLPFNRAERVFLQSWQKENSRGTQSPLRVIWERDTGKELTQDIATAVATMMQWLGTNCGRCWLDSTIKMVADDHKYRSWLMHAHKGYALPEEWAKWKKKDKEFFVVKQLDYAEREGNYFSGDCQLLGKDLRALIEGKLSYETCVTRLEYFFHDYKVRKLEESILRRKRMIVEILALGSEEELLTHSNADRRKKYFELVNERKELAKEETDLIIFRDRLDTVKEKYKEAYTNDSPNPANFCDIIL